jgi:hypothetical protein
MVPCTPARCHIPERSTPHSRENMKSQGICCSATKGWKILNAESWRELSGLGCRYIQWRTEGGGGGWGVQKPPTKFRSLAKSNRIGNWAENVWCSYSNSLISLKVAEFRTPTPQDVQKESSKILKPPVRNCFTLAMTNKLVVIINSLKYQKWRKFYYIKWNFLYQITAASRTPD